MVINCPQTKFVAIVLVLWFYAMFCLTRFSTDPISSLRVLSLTILEECDSTKMF